LLASDHDQDIDAYIVNNHPVTKQQQQQKSQASPSLHTNTPDNNFFSSNANNDDALLVSPSLMYSSALVSSHFQKVALADIKNDDEHDDGRHDADEGEAYVLDQEGVANAQPLRKMSSSLSRTSAPSSANDTSSVLGHATSELSSSSSSS